MFKFELKPDNGYRKQHAAPVTPHRILTRPANTPDRICQQNHRSRKTGSTQSTPFYKRSVRMIESCDF